MSPKTAAFIDFMFENELFDVLAKEGKAAGGYCTMLYAYKAPFIFSNFNGTSGDVDVLTHEAGHAFAFYESRNQPLAEYVSPTSEACEVHSMSMEFFCWKYLDYFYGAQTKKAKLQHLTDALIFLPYGTMVDHFQHIVYENPSLTPAERNAEWLRLEKIYRPFMDASACRATRTAASGSASSISTNIRFIISITVLRRPLRLNIGRCRRPIMRRRLRNTSRSSNRAAV